MKLTVECFNKVKKDCLKFIKSQETKADRFKNKERMIKLFLIPLCFWISKKTDKKRPYFVGLAGGQGTGKTTISSLIKIILTKYFKLNVFRISIDDFYKTRKERMSLSKRVHPMLLTRGVPGTHDINMMLNFFRKTKSKDFKIVKGEDKLKLYQFHSKVAKHYFCSDCGIYTHHNPRINPAMTGFNVGCIDEINTFDLKKVPVNDGQNHPLDKK